MHWPRCIWRYRSEDFDEATMDACLIAGGQRAEHYEMAAYGSLIAWARAQPSESQSSGRW